MAKMAFFLAAILTISFTCSATLGSEKPQAQFENSMNITLTTFQSLIDGIVEEQGSPGSLAEKNATGIIPRKVLFSALERDVVQISPDGKWISYLSAFNGVLNVWIAPANNISDARPITNETSSGIQAYSWAFSNRHIIYIQDASGDEKLARLCR